jgi:hypothetical protein
MNPRETADFPDVPIDADPAPEPEELGPGDSFDEPGPPFVSLASGTAFETWDEALFLDAPHDDEERDDEPMLALLFELGVDLDVLDAPEESGHLEIAGGFDERGEPDEDEMAA